MPLKFYSRKGRPLADVHEWAELYENDRYRVVLITTVVDDDHPEDRWEVSTLWHGIDHDRESALDGAMLPCFLFETMTIQRAPGGEVTFDRWVTEADAMRGHGAVVGAICSGMSKPATADAVGLGTPTSGGVELTDRLVEQLAADAERGYEPSQVRARPE